MAAMVFLWCSHCSLLAVSQKKMCNGVCTEVCVWSDSPEERQEHQPCVFYTVLNFAFLYDHCTLM